jgi:5-methylcytosine-specific restriction endonuclease McrA
MPRACTVCVHPEEEAINRALVEPTKLCTWCGAFKPQSAFHLNFWRWNRKDRTCIACTQVRVALLDAWHRKERAEKERRHRLVKEHSRRWDAARAEYLASIPQKVLRGQQAQNAIVRLRPQIIARDGYTCGLCKGPVEPQDLSIDHIIPITRGGGDDPDNLQVTHLICNVRKGNRNGS